MNFSLDIWIAACIRLYALLIRVYMLIVIKLVQVLKCYETFILVLVTTRYMPPTSPMGVISESAAAQLLDFSQRLDIGLLDRVVNCMYHEAGDQQKIAEKVLNTLKEHPDAWMRVDSILEFSSNQETKYFALQILEALIKTRWKVLARPQCEGNQYCNPKLSS